MCGIVGFFLKDAKLEPELGRLTAAMLSELRDRGPDSAGCAVYGGETASLTKICVVAPEGAVAGRRSPSGSPRPSGSATVAGIEDHAISRPWAGDVARSG
jgi:amidophosphoribosyltransferase